MSNRITRKFRKITNPKKIIKSGNVKKKKTKLSRMMTRRVRRKNEGEKSYQNVGGTRVVPISNNGSKSKPTEYYSGKIDYKNNDGYRIAGVYLAYDNSSNVRLHDDNIQNQFGDLEKFIEDEKTKYLFDQEEIAKKEKHLLDLAKKYDKMMDQSFNELKGMLNKLWDFKDEETIPPLVGEITEYKTKLDNVLLSEFTKFKEGDIAEEINKFENSNPLQNISDISYMTDLSFNHNNYKISTYYIHYKKIMFEDDHTNTNSLNDGAFDEDLNYIFKKKDYKDNSEYENLINDLISKYYNDKHYRYVNSEIIKIKKETSKKFYEKIEQGISKMLSKY